MASSEAPRYQDIVEAAGRISSQAIRTPLVSNAVLNRLVGADVYLKPECLQRTGSFKFRGAFNAISQLTPEDRQRGIVATSSGNHAQGVAEAARIMGAASTIVMPSDAPVTKIERTQRSGAKVVFYDRAGEDREKAVASVLKETGGVFIHPFNNRNVIAGQGTVGLELADDLETLGRKPDRVLVCTGGGGLTAGVALAIHNRFPEAVIHPVEPEGFDDYRRSLEADEILSNDRTAGSVCDAVITPTPGAIGFDINRKILSQGLIVSDQEALQAVRFAFEELKLVVEPGGAVALAALLKHAEAWRGETIVVTLSGGNIDSDVLETALHS